MEEHMEGKEKVFVSHCHEDNARCEPLLRVLQEWQIDYWFDTQQISAGDHFLQLIEHEIEARDIFLRVRSQAAQKSYWVQLETDTFQCLLADDYGRGLSAKRRLINVIVDPQYVLEPFVKASLYIDIVHIPEAEWREKLQRVLTGHTEQIPASPSPDLEKEKTSGENAPFSLPPQSGIQVFVDDDQGYQKWVRDHASGFVLNSYRTPQPDYVMLHRTTCGWIRRPIERGDRLTDAFVKICSLDRSSLENWSRQQFGMDAHPCGLCKPR